MATCSSILAWRITWGTEAPGGLQSIGLQNAGHDRSDLACTHGEKATSTFLSILLLTAKPFGGDIYLGIPDKEWRRKDKEKIQLLFMNLVIY